MNNYPEYAEINDKKYKINTDFRVAIECQNIATDENISDYERALAIIYKLFGDDGIEDFNNYDKLLEIATKYLSLIFLSISSALNFNFGKIGTNISLISSYIE